MRLLLFVPFALICALSTPAAAQTGAQPNLVLTILGGAVTGHQLWAVAKQPLTVLGNPTTYDTLQLSRSVGSSLVLGAAATYFPATHIAIHAEVSYLGLPLDNRCSVVGAYAPDTENKNEQICDDIDAQAVGGGAISVFTGVTIRAAPRGAFSPYVRGNIGLVNQARSTIEVVGGFVDGTGFHERQVIADPKPRRNTAMFGVGAGFTSPLGPGYQFRFELRDVITQLDRLTGPANAIGIGPTAGRHYHHFALTLGLDVVLERKRGRRY
ncbi:MAG TPA: hypothetical protein VGQ06_09110 [Gemmatimonadales bacterium]|jgi:hypothetical protein|nr:hypothetical protein [Gemmatimonadales bacterium]